MLHEFAVEPEAIAESWETFRYIFEKFSVEEGRVISRFPRRWAAEVHGAIGDGVSWANRQRMEVLLREGKNRIISFEREFTGGAAWRDEAMRSHGVRPFYRMILSEPVDDDESVATSDELDESFFACAREAQPARRAPEIAATLAPLLACSAQVMLVDQHFNPTRRKWTAPLIALMEAAKAGSRRCAVVEYHIKQKDTERADGRWQENFKEECRRCLEGILPDGIELRIIRWDDSGATNKIHERYVLTDVAGVSVDPGLDESVEEDTARLVLMANATWMAQRRDFLGEGDLRLVDEVTVRRA